EWVESLKAVLDNDGAERAHQLLERMVELTRRAGARLPFHPTTEYVNTIPPHPEAKTDGDPAMEWRTRRPTPPHAQAKVAPPNPIPPHLEAKSDGDPAMEWRIRRLIRWNAMAMVVRANRKPGDLGGHIASFASSATLYDVGFNHFWRAPGEQHPGDLVYFQGHSSPGIYARSFLEGRISEDQLDNF